MEAKEPVGRASGPSAEGAVAAREAKIARSLSAQLEVEEHMDEQMVGQPHFVRLEGTKAQDEKREKKSLGMRGDGRDEPRGAQAGARQSVEIDALRQRVTALEQSVFTYDMELDALKAESNKLERATQLPGDKGAWRQRYEVASVHLERSARAMEALQRESEATESRTRIVKQWLRVLYGSDKVSRRHLLELRAANEKLRTAISAAERDKLRLERDALTMEDGYVRFLGRVTYSVACGIVSLRRVHASAIIGGGQAAQRFAALRLINFDTGVLEIFEEPAARWSMDEVELVRGRSQVATAEPSTLLFHGLGGGDQLLITFETSQERHKWLGALRALGVATDAATTTLPAVPAAITAP